MRSIIIFFAAFLLTVSFTQAQSEDLENLAPFEDIVLEGNIRLYLENGSKSHVRLEAKKQYHIAEYDVEVRNGTLHIKYNSYENGWGSTPKLYVYLTHPGIHGIDMDGLVHINSTDTYRSERVAIKGDGLIRGELDITVDELKIDLDGMCKMTVVGQADYAELRVDGLGKIDARGLRADKYHQSSDGIASIKVGN